MVRGRKEIVLDKQLLINLFEQYLRDHPYTKEIKISEITNYCLQEFNHGNFPIKLSREFWGRKNRQGGQFLEQINSELGMKHSKFFEYPIVSTKKIIETCAFINEKDKKYITNNLIVNEIGLQKTLKEIEVLDRDNKTLEEKNTSLKCKLESYEQKIQAYESILFQWADISSHKDIKILDAITTGKNRSKLVRELFEDIFTDNPTKALLNINIPNNISVEPNVVPISNSKKLLQELELLD